MVIDSLQNEIERKVFKGYSLSFDRLVSFGFVESEDGFVYETSIKDFLVKVKISNKGEVTALLFDKDTEEEYTNFRLNGVSGFAYEAREDLIALLMKIREECARKENFLYPETERVLNLVKETYGDDYETPWGKEEDGIIVRNPKTKKWYLLIMRVSGEKLDPSLASTLEVMNVRVGESLVSNLIKEKGIFPAYHMNKKYWITVLLDGSVSESGIMDLIAISHKYTER